MFFRYLYLVIGVLLGYICTPQFSVYEITDVVWVQTPAYEQNMLDGMRCYYIPRSTE